MRFTTVKTLLLTLVFNYNFPIKVFKKRKCDSFVASKVNELSFWFVYFILDPVYKFSGFIFKALT